MFRTVRFLGLILVLVLVLGAPAASAAGSREPEDLSLGGFLSALWETLADLVPGSWVDALSLSGTAPDGDDSGDPNSGPGMDPNGKPGGP